MKRLSYIVFFFLVSFYSLDAQVSNSLIQVSGIITDDEKKPVVHVSIISQRLRRGTISEETGIYSVISLPGDTIHVSALGYKNYLFRVPPDLEGRHYKKDISLVSDTISIEGVNIFPWKTYEEFKRDVLAHKVVTKPEIQFMYDNLASIRYALANNPSYSVSPEAGYRMAMQQNSDAVIYRNQPPVNNLLNPFAWAKFFNGLKSGLLKNQKTEKATKTKSKEKKKKTNQG